MSFGGGNSTTTTKADPWIGQQPYISDSLANAKGLYQSEIGRTYYPGQTVAGMDPSHTAGVQTLGDQANRLTQNGYINNAMNAVNGITLSGPSSPYIGQIADQITQKYTQNLNRNVLPELGSAATRAGAYGSDRADIAQGVAAGDAMTGLSSALTQMYQTDYQNNAQNKIQAAAMLPSLQQASLLPGQTQTAIGDMNRAYEQQLIDSDVAKWNFAQTQPWNLLGQYMSMTSGNYGYQGATTSSPGAASTAGGAIGGALIGSAFGASEMGKALELTGTTGGAMGAILSLMGAL